MEEKKLTGYPSIDKPWMKYYKADLEELQTPTCTVYERIYNNNFNHPKETALMYFGKSISYQEMFDEIEKVAKAFTFMVSSRMIMSPYVCLQRLKQFIPFWR